MSELVNVLVISTGFLLATVVWYRVVFKPATTTRPANHENGDET